MIPWEWNSNLHDRMQEYAKEYNQGGHASAIDYTTLNPSRIHMQVQECIL